MATINESIHIRELATLDRRIAANEAMQNSLRQQQTNANRAILLAGARHAYRKMQFSLRAPAMSFNLWPVGVMLIGPLIPGCLAFAMFAAWSLPFAFAAFVMAFGLTATLLACLLFVPNNSNLEALARTAEAILRDAQSLADQIRTELTSVERGLQKDKQAKGTIEKSVQYKRESLLQQNWKAMRGVEWEAFLADAFHLLGGVVETTKTSGDQGVDLVVTIGQRRYAIQAKGYVSSVGNSAVQEAVAGMAHYRCNCSAVITNSRFTPGAVALAESNCCVLIGEDRIPAFVLGKLPF